MDKKIINCQTGKEEVVEMTSEEILQREAEVEETRIREEKEKNELKAKNKAKQDAKTKLKSLKSKGKDFEELVDSFATLLNIDLDKEVWRF